MKDRSQESGISEDGTAGITSCDFLSGSSDLSLCVFPDSSGPLTVSHTGYFFGSQAADPPNLSLVFMRTWSGIDATLPP